MTSLNSSWGAGRAGESATALAGCSERGQGGELLCSDGALLGVSSVKLRYLVH